MPDAVMEYQQLLIEAGGRAFFLYNGTQPMIANLEETARIMRGPIKMEWDARVHSGVDRLAATTVLNTLDALLHARDECLDGIPLQSVAFDGVPTIGGLGNYLRARALALNNGNSTVNLGYCYRCGGPAPCCAYAHGLKRSWNGHAFNSMDAAHDGIWDCPGCLPSSSVVV